MTLAEWLADVLGREAGAIYEEHRTEAAQGNVRRAGDLYGWYQAVNRASREAKTKTVWSAKSIAKGN